MRCKLNDRVIVIRGSASGAIGTIVDQAALFATVFKDCDWLVQFPRPIPSMGMGGATTSSTVNMPDAVLWPLPDDPELVAVDVDQEICT